MAAIKHQAFSHSVYFTLKEKSSENCDRLVAACQQYLSNHPGTLHFSAGCRAIDYDRPVNDQEFDVALVLIFANEAHHEKYQVSESHKQFLAEMNEYWAEVRVFDALA